MKKSLVAAITSALVVGVASTTFAAANPFVDVPAKHWSYDAVAKLAKDGIVDGYGDGTFKGDKTLTRYEMAQIVAKALAKSDKANAADKAAIDKLAVEFSAELNNLGVRVAKLEASQSNVKFSGTMNIRYRSMDYDDNANSPSDIVEQYRLRLNATAKVDDKTTFGLRLVNRAPDSSDFANNTWTGTGNLNNGQKNQEDDNNVKLDRVFINTKVGVVDTTIGRQALGFATDPYNILVDSGAYSYDGIKLGAKAGAVNYIVNHGRFTNNLSAAAVGSNPINVALENLDVDSLTATSKVGKLDYGVGYAQLRNYRNAKGDLLRYYTGNASYAFTKKFVLGAEYANNDAADDSNNVWSLKAVIGDQVLNAKGKNNVVMQYTDVGKYSLVNRLSTLDTPGKDVYDDYTVFDVNYNYAFSKTFNGQLQYVKVDNDDKTIAKGSYNYFKATLNVAF